MALLFDEAGERIAQLSLVGDDLGKDVASSYLSIVRHVAEHVYVANPLLLTVSQLLVGLVLMPIIKKGIAHFATVKFITVGFHKVSQMIPCVVESSDTCILVHHRTQIGFHTKPDVL